MKNILLIITLFISWNAIAEEKTWYCSTEKIGGLHYVDDTWKTVTFTDMRMTVSQTDNNLKFSNNVLNFSSEKRCGLGNGGSVITCTDYSTIFTLNPENGFATSAIIFGWLFKGEDSLQTALWRCESF